MMDSINVDYIFKIKRKQVYKMQAASFSNQQLRGGVASNER